MFTPNFQTLIEKLCAPQTLKDVFRAPLHEAPAPCVQAVQCFVDTLTKILFQDFYPLAHHEGSYTPYHMASNLDTVLLCITEQIYHGACFVRAPYALHQQECMEKAHEKASIFLQSLPQIQKALLLDAKAAYDGDPAASGLAEIVLAYPCIKALTHHRIAHELYRLEVPMLPRMIASLAHQKTGIEIHPAATIGSSFFIDHGTGVTIGASSHIGNHCRFYQGVTLGELHVQKRDFMLPQTRSHPHIGNNVVIYAGAHLLGPITVGDDVIIGAREWVTEDVASNTKLLHGVRSERKAHKASKASMAKVS